MQIENLLFAKSNLIKQFITRIILNNKPSFFILFTRKTNIQKKRLTSSFHQQVKYQI